MATMIATTMGVRRVIGLSNRHDEPPGYGCQQSGTLVPESGPQSLSELAAGLAAATPQVNPHEWVGRTG